MTFLKYFLSAYGPATNQLKHIGDAAPSANYTEDIDGQSNAANYVYDKIENLIADNSDKTSEKIANISWGVYGKILSINKPSGTISYTYDAGGNRISKTAAGKTTVYKRNASGNMII